MEKSPPNKQGLSIGNYPEAKFQRVGEKEVCEQNSRENPIPPTPITFGGLEKRRETII